MSYPIEEIPDESFVYRQVLPHERIGAKNRRFPNEAHFQLKDDENGLSVHWDKYITLNEIYLLLSLTHNKKERFLEHTAFKVFKYPVGYLRNISEIKNVIHSPVYNGNPSPIGQPNNRAHADVVYKNDPEILLKLSDYCQNNYDDAYCPFDVNSINEKAKELKKLLNESDFHKM